jgi:hypothetical protein
MSRSAVTTTSVGDIASLQRDFERSQRAARRSPQTIETYREGIVQLAAFVERQGMPVKVASIRREHVEAFMTELNAPAKPATASTWRVSRRSVRHHGVSPRADLNPKGLHAPNGRMATSATPPTVVRYADLIGTTTPLRRPPGMLPLARRPRVRRPAEQNADSVARQGGSRGSS